MPYITTPFDTWSMLLCLLTLHLYLNYKAVRAVSMQSLNRQRACILMSTLIENGHVLTPAQVKNQEEIFSQGSNMKWKTCQTHGTCHIGVSLQTLLQSMGMQSSQTGSFKDLDNLSELLNLFKDQHYLLWHDVRTTNTSVVLKQEASPLDHVKAWTHALILANEIQHGPRDVTAPWMMTTIMNTLDKSNSLFTTHLAAIKAAGWDLSIPHMETKSGSRISIAQY